MNYLYKVRSLAIKYTKKGEDNEIEFFFFG